MLFMVEMDVNIPLNFDQDEAARIKAEEKAYFQSLQASGLRHLAPHLAQGRTLRERLNL